MNLSTHSSKNKNTINIITLGCSKNLVDSENLLAHLDKNGFEIKHNADQPSDVVIINTCGFILDAKQESIDTILYYVNLKQEKKITALIVMGCLSERYRKDLRNEIPEVDAFFGVNEIPEILQFLKTNYHDELMFARYNTNHHFAYLKISEGCDRYCAFCAIPMIRGKHVSRSIPSLIDESVGLVENGAKELILISQDLSYYGLDNYKKQKLPELLEKLSETKGVEWIRLHYLFPNNMPLKILDLMAGRDNICNYIDIPFQHISNNILKRMNRNITKRQTYKLLDILRAKVPGAAIRTSLMTGYPGETKEDFRELTDFVKEARFERMGVFIYSHEEDTPAYELKDDVPYELKKERMEILMDIQQSISSDFNHRQLGKILKVLVDRTEGGYFVGRTEFDSPEVDNEVLIKSRKQLIPGKFYNVTIESAEDFDLYGSV